MRAFYGRFASCLSLFIHDFSRNLMVLSMFEPGSCFILVRKWLGSLADCERALKLDPRLVTAICTQADVKRLLGDYKGAVSDATVALRLGRGLWMALEAGRHSPNCAAAFSVRHGAEL